MNKNQKTKLNLDYIIKEMKEINPKIEIIDDVYINNKHGIKSRCLVCGHEWSPCWGSLRRGQGCPKCARVKHGERITLSIEQVKSKLRDISPEIKVLSANYVNAHEKIKVQCIKDGCGKIWFARYSNLSQGGGCPSCANRDLTMGIIRDKLENISPSIQILENSYKTNITHMNVKCLVCSHEWLSTWSKLQYGVGCPNCANIKKIKPEKGKSLGELYPESLKYLKNKSDAYNYKPYSKLRLDFICPDCGKEKKMSLSDFTGYGLGCNYCGDKKSFPEKVMRSILIDTGLDFEIEKTFEWLKNRRYDFYIPTLNTIIEIHGGQHYLENPFMGGNNVMRIDEIKREVAELNGIENYIEVDCRVSDFQFIKSNILKDLSHIINLSNINWDKIFKTSQKSMVLIVWDEYNNKRDETIDSIAKRLKIGKTTFYRYLRKGIEIGVVNKNK